MSGSSSSDSRSRVVILLSGAGSTAAAVMAAAAGDYPAQVVAVGSDRPDAAGLQIAADHGIPTFVVPPRDYADRSAWDMALAEAVAEWQPDLVLCAGFMRILGAAMLERFSPALINSHPSLLPSFPGAHAVADALAYGVKVAGVTVHIVVADVDAGPIIAQEAVPVLDGDDDATLHERIKQRERLLLVDVVARLANRTVQVDNRRVSVT